MDVVLLRWPAESERRRRLHEKGVPRLLLVEDGHPPPPPDDCLEDWIRVPAGEHDVRVRIGGLSSRASAHVPGQPQLDGDGVLRYGTGWVPLPPLEARLTTALLERMGAVVSRETLTRAGWPEEAPGRNALDVHVLRLRRRLAAVGLCIKTVRSRGYLLEPAADAIGPAIDLTSVGPRQNGATPRSGS